VQLAQGGVRRVPSKQEACHLFRHFPVLFPTVEADRRSRSPLRLVVRGIAVRLFGRRRRRFLVACATIEARESFREVGERVPRGVQVGGWVAEERAVAFGRLRARGESPSETERPLRQQRPPGTCPDGVTRSRVAKRFPHYCRAENGGRLPRLESGIEEKPFPALGLLARPTPSVRVPRSMPRNGSSAVLRVSFPGSNRVTWDDRENGNAFQPGGMLSGGSASRLAHLPGAQVIWLIFTHLSARSESLRLFRLASPEMSAIRRQHVLDQ
jgi:hypothetical protein